VSKRRSRGIFVVARRVGVGKTSFAVLGGNNITKKISVESAGNYSGAETNDILAQHKLLHIISWIPSKEDFQSMYTSANLLRVIPVEEQSRAAALARSWILFQLAEFLSRKKPPSWQQKKQEQFRARELHQGLTFFAEI